MAGKKIVGEVPRPHTVSHFSAPCLACGAGVFDSKAEQPCDRVLEVEVGGDAERSRLESTEESRPHPETDS